MATDETFVRAICAKLGLEPFTRSLSLRQMADVLFEGLGTRKLRNVAHAKILLDRSPVAMVADVNALSSTEVKRLFEILMRNGGEAPMLAGD